jgi:PAS domain S-box-containing protein
MILDDMSDAILLLNTQKAVENCNPAFSALFGYSPDEISGQTLYHLAAPGSEAALTTALQTLTETQQHQRLQMGGRHKDGHILDVDIALAIVRHGEHSIVCSIRDITPLKETERAKDAFVSMVNHELREPITAATTISETLLRYYERFSDERRLEKIAQIHQIVGSLGELMTAIVEISRFDARPQQPIPNVIDIGQAVQTIVAQLRPQAEANQQQLEVVLPAPSLSVIYGQAILIRVWQNLICNAIKYAGAGRAIQVQVCHPDSSLPDMGSRVLAAIPKGFMVGIVTDNGPGIPEKDLPNLFTRFFRGWAAGSNIPGNGLGLAFVRDILRANGGDIAVESMLNGETQFSFWLPIGNKP